MIITLCIKTDETSHGCSYCTQDTFGCFVGRTTLLDPLCGGGSSDIPSRSQMSSNDRSMIDNIYIFSYNVHVMYAGCPNLYISYSPNYRQPDGANY